MKCTLPLGHGAPKHRSLPEQHLIWALKGWRSVRTLPTYPCPSVLYTLCPFIWRLQNRTDKATTLTCCSQAARDSHPLDRTQDPEKHIPFNDHLRRQRPEWAIEVASPSMDLVTIAQAGFVKCKELFAAKYGYLVDDLPGSWIEEAARTPPADAAPTPVFAPAWPARLPAVVLHIVTSQDGITDQDVNTAALLLHVVQHAPTKLSTFHVIVGTGIAGRLLAVALGRCGLSVPQAYQLLVDLKRQLDRHSESSLADFTVMAACSSGRMFTAANGPAVCVDVRGGRGLRLSFDGGPAKAATMDLPCWAAARGHTANVRLKPAAMQSVKYAIPASTTAVPASASPGPAGVLETCMGQLRSRATYKAVVLVGKLNPGQAGTVATQLGMAARDVLPFPAPCEPQMAGEVKSPVQLFLESDAGKRTVAALSSVV